jgi:hypothetical protein
MTEAERLTSVDPVGMHDFLLGRAPASSRRNRLFAAACTRANSLARLLPSTNTATFMWKGQY